MSTGDVLRPLGIADVRAAVAVHLAAFQGFYLATLGPSFLSLYYETVLSVPGGICLGAFEGERICGVVAGFVDPAAFYCALRSRKWALAAAALPALLRDPRRVGRFLVNYRRTGHGQAPAGQDVAELASLAVLPEYSGRGLGAQLVRAFVTAAADHGAVHVTLTTDAAGNDRVNRFYLGLGFRRARCFEAQPGRLLNEYVLPVASESAPGGADGDERQQRG